jgi:hypothetical protein
VVFKRVRLHDWEVLGSVAGKGRKVGVLYLLALQSLGRVMEVSQLLETSLHLKLY